ncbi:MAG: ADP-ribosylation factor-like protein [Promethearchaeota archaeon]
MEEKKIIVSGLDNAGKTSMLLALNKKYDFEKIVKELAPTIRIEYNRANYLGMPINIWDMGGQSNYREVYIRRMEYYFAETDTFYFVVDVQDPNKFEDALDYLTGILKFYYDEDMKVPTFILFHKVDPDIQEDPEIRERLESLKKKFLQKLFFWKTHMVFMETSIYDVQSIVTAFSHGLSMFIPSYEDLLVLFEKYGEATKRVAMFLMDAKGIILAENYDRNLQPELLHEIFDKARESIVLTKKMEEEGTYMDLIADTGSEQGLEFQMHRLKVNSANFFLVLMLKEEFSFLLDEVAPDLRAELVETIEKITHSI